MRHAVPFLIVVFFAGAAAPAQQTTDDQILFRSPPGRNVVDSAYGPVASFQVGLLAEAGRCGIPVVHPEKFAAGQFGDASSKVLQKVAACRSLTLSDPSGRTITEAAWRALVPGTPPPGPRQRARSMSFRFEGTDYTQIEWNLGTSDPGILTWGPLGATAGQAAQVQSILAAIVASQPDLITTAFGDEADAIKRFSALRSTASASAFIADIMAYADRKASWTRGFAMIGREPQAREIYDGLMDAAATAGVPEAINDFTLAYWARCRAPTEVDYGFFFDRAIQLNVSRKTVGAASILVDTAERRAGRTFTAAERRRAYAASWTAQAKNGFFAGDRLARDVGYYVDQIPERELTDARLLALRANPESTPAKLNSELLRWKSRSGLRASDYGLSDSRVLPAPASLQAKIPDCLKSAYGG